MAGKLRDISVPIALFFTPCQRQWDSHVVRRARAASKRPTMSSGVGAVGEPVFVCVVIMFSLFTEERLALGAKTSQLKQPAVAGCG